MKESALGKAPNALASNLQSKTMKVFILGKSHTHQKDKKSHTKPSHLVQLFGLITWVDAPVHKGH